MSSTRLCHSLANCINTAGSYRCDCHTGYVFSGDGYTCVGKKLLFRKGDELLNRFE